MKTWFITRSRDIYECRVIYETPRKRIIEIVEDCPLKGKKITTHPKGVAKGKLYPRVFESETKPGFFEFKGRLLAFSLQDEKTKNLIPIKEKYFYQPITSQVIDSILGDDKILLTGHAGTGKTSMIEQVAAEIGQPVIRINMNGETRISDFLGKINVANGRTFWTYGVLPLAMKNGYWLIADELDAAEPNILSLLHPVLEDNGRLVLKENDGEVVFPHPNFRFFATANSIGSMQDRSDIYTGLNIMNSAMLDRFHILEMPNMDSKLEIKVLKARVPALKHKWVKSIIQFANLIRSQSGAERQVNLDFSTRRCLQFAKKLALYRDPIIAAESVFLFKVSSEDKEWLISLIKTTFDTKKQDSGDDSILPQKKKRGRPPKKQVI